MEAVASGDRDDVEDLPFDMPQRPFIRCQRRDVNRNKWKMSSSQMTVSQPF